MAYTKLFNSIVTSTIWTEDDRTRIVWITMLALADKNGEVQGSIPGIARVAGVPVEDCRSAIAKFLSPDPDSRTKDDEGRRIVEIEGGWHLINHRHYRDLASKEEVAASEAKRKARYRAQLKRNGRTCPADVPQCPEPVPPASASVPEISHIAEAEAPNMQNADAEEIPNTSTLPSAKAGGEKKRFSQPSVLDVEQYGRTIDFNIDGEQFCNFYESKGWVIGKSPMKDWKAAVRTWKTARTNGSANHAAPTSTEPGPLEKLYAKNITTIART